MTYHAKPMANGVGQFTGKLQSYRDGSLGAYAQAAAGMGQFTGSLMSYRDGILGEPPGGKMPGAYAAYRDGVLGEYFAGAAGMGGVLGEYFSGVGQTDDETTETPIPAAPQEVLPLPAPTAPPMVPVDAPIATGSIVMSYVVGAGIVYGIWWWLKKK